MTVSDPRVCEYFTLLFRGDIRAFKRNPLMTETPFGIPIAAGIGDAFAELDEARMQLELLEP
jgi:hypothetical protein